MNKHLDTHYVWVNGMEFYRFRDDSCINKVDKVHLHKSQKSSCNIDLIRFTALMPDRRPSHISWMYLPESGALLCGYVGRDGTLFQGIYKSSNNYYGITRALADAVFEKHVLHRRVSNKDQILRTEETIEETTDETMIIRYFHYDVDYFGCWIPHITQVRDLVRPSAEINIIAIGAKWLYDIPSETLRQGEIVMGEIRFINNRKWKRPWGPADVWEAIDGI